MERMTLREAADRTSRSITTLRRYIRSGRLHAEKRFGRFGPEYFVASSDLAEAGLEPERSGDLPAVRGDGSTMATTADGANGSERGGVPLSLYQDLQMKHEQLLVQYGMMRASGLRLLEIERELEDRQHALDEARADGNRIRRQMQQLRDDTSRELRRSRLELEGKSLEISALQEKVRALEMLTRNAETTESIDQQFSEVMNQARKVRRAQRDREPSPSATASSSPGSPGSSDSPSSSSSSSPRVGDRPVWARPAPQVAPEH